MLSYPVDLFTYEIIAQLFEESYDEVDNQWFFFGTIFQSLSPFTNSSLTLLVEPSTHIHWRVVSFKSGVPHSILAQLGQWIPLS